MSEQRYRVIERLEAGGMAEVFVGEAQSVQGFKKRVAIKRVLPHLAENRSFMQMFLDEARLGARLDHANIVSVFDIGAADNTFFLVMEFVDGMNLKSLMEALRQQGRSFPVKEALYICMEACRGLSYAHELYGEDDEPLNIVHRDVSPPNLLLSGRGEVKVTDFGLAKAATQLEKTDPGVVKGKFSYLSPEAALGQPVDQRADVFSLGIVLWEMLAGRRLFLGENDYQTVKLVQAAKIPNVRHLNASVGGDFEQVMSTALARDPAERYQSAREFGDALAGYLFSHQLKVTSYDLANLVRSCREKETKRAKAKQQSIIHQLIQEEMGRFTSIDDIAQDPLSERVSPAPDHVAGATPLDAGAFENPTEWFDDDSLSTGAAPRPSGDGNLGWFESGIEQGPQSGLGQPAPGAEAAGRASLSDGLAALLEADEGRSEPPSPAQLEPIPLGTAHTLRNADDVGEDEDTDMRPAPASGGPWKILLVAVVVLAGAGAAIWFGLAAP